MGERIRVILRQVQIFDNLEPFFDDEGEFRFHIRVATSNRGGVVEETTVPQDGYYPISDHPAWNRQLLDKVIFEGEVDDHLEVEIKGEELDVGSSDWLTPYRRVFHGSPSEWIGSYRPGDEGSNDPERMKDWGVFLEIERA